MDRGKVFFASDFHLGIDTILSSREREKKIIRWLDEIKEEAHEIYLLGDIFDFWFEYRSVVPRGYTRLLGKLAEIVDFGIPIYVFSGNHDMWLFDYFPRELGITILRKPIQKKIHNHVFYIGHGDGLGPGDHGYKMIKKIFASPICQWLFARVHPNFSFRLAQYWSGRSRDHTQDLGTFTSVRDEWIYQYILSLPIKSEIDFFLFGHRHLPIHTPVENTKAIYINTGDWMYHFSYAVYDGNNVQLHFFEPSPGYTEVYR